MFPFPSLSRKGQDRTRADFRDPFLIFAKSLISWRVREDSRSRPSDPWSQRHHLRLFPLPSAQLRKRVVNQALSLHSASARLRIFCPVNVLFWVADRTLSSWHPDVTAASMS